MIHRRRLIYCFPPTDAFSNPIRGVTQADNPLIAGWVPDCSSVDGACLFLDCFASSPSTLLSWPSGITSHVARPSRANAASGQHNSPTGRRLAQCRTLPRKAAAAPKGPSVGSIAVAGENTPSPLKLMPPPAGRADASQIRPAGDTSPSRSRGRRSRFPEAW